MTHAERVGKARRGFASMDKELQREIARKGGRAAHEKGTAHEFNADEAKTAGKKGGDTVSRDREHMARIGKEGGQARATNRARAEQNQHEAAELPGPGWPRRSQFEEAG